MTKEKLTEWKLDKKAEAYDAAVAQDIDWTEYDIRLAQIDKLQ